MSSTVLGTGNWEYVMRYGPSLQGVHSRSRLMALFLTDHKAFKNNDVLLRSPKAQRRVIILKD